MERTIGSTIHKENSNIFLVKSVFNDECNNKATVGVVGPGAPVGFRAAGF
jgi:hypothetical protein